jgi:hypothetical protein
LAVPEKCTARGQRSALPRRWENRFSFCVADFSECLNLEIEQAIVEVAHLGGAPVQSTEGFDKVFISIAKRLKDSKNGWGIVDHKVRVSQECTQRSKPTNRAWRRETYGWLWTATPVPQ